MPRGERKNSAVPWKFSVSPRTVIAQRAYPLHSFSSSLPRARTKKSFATVPDYTFFCKNVYTRSGRRKGDEWRGHMTECDKVRRTCSHLIAPAAFFDTHRTSNIITRDSVLETDLSAPIIFLKFPPYLYGLHDIGGHDRMLSAQRPGWVLDAVDLRSQAGTDYTSLAQSGLGVIVRLNYNGETLPPPDQFTEFAARCAAYAKNSPGARVWLIGDAINTRPASDSREIVSPLQYAQCFRQCRAAIKNLSAHADALVIPGAVVPFNADAGDWVNYFAQVMNALTDADGAPGVDGIALRVHTHDYNLNQITSDDLMDAPFAGRHYNLRAYRDFLHVLPESFRTLPVFITQANPLKGWRDENIGWIQRAGQEINDWNSDPNNQPIQALVLYRWLARSEPDAWSIQDKPALIDDFRAALAAGYRARWETKEVVAQRPEPAEGWAPDADSAAVLPPVSEPPRAPATEPEPTIFQSPISNLQPPISQWRAQFLAHDTPVNLIAGQTVSVNLRVKNTGAREWKQSGITPVHAGYQWFRADGTRVREADDRRTALPDDILPDHARAFGAVLATPRTPGDFVLRWDLIAEGETWFADAGSVPLAVPVRVVAVPQDVTGWRVESDPSPERVARALDGDASAFWDSGAPQAAGQWFRLNLGAPRVVDGIQFLSPGKGFPAAYSLRLSPDGRTWTEISRIAEGNTSDVLAVFAPMLAQYAQIDLLAASESSWMISEILAHHSAEWRVSASHHADAAPRATDNRSETAWTSVDAQTPGMWLQIDLGRAEKVSGLMLIAPEGEYPRGFRVTVWNAGANRWQIACEKTNPRGDVEALFPATPTQFIVVQLVQPADAAWGIRHARVYREMDDWLGPRA